MTPLVSIVIPTMNSGMTLRECLDSIMAQTCRDFELIIVDGFSTDDTISIAREYTPKVFTCPGEIPAARNLGFSKAKGDIFLSVDSDMILEKNLLEDIVSRLENHGSLIIPEVGHGKDFLSRCKDLEKRCYLGDSTIESARAFSRVAFLDANGYDGDLVLGEDWDLHSRIRNKHSVGRTEAMLYHNTRHLSLLGNLKKAYRYGKSLPKYLNKKESHFRSWSNILFIRHFRKLLSEPLCGAGLFIIKSLEYLAGVIGFLSSKLS